MSRLLSIQALRGLAVLGVVAFHAQIVEQKYSGGDSLLPLFLDVGRSGVDLFFVISGFVMVMVTQGRFGLAGEAPRFLWGRLSRIYPTYWFYFALTAAVFVVRPQWVNASQGHEVRLLSSFLLWPSDRLPLVMVAWSLIHELWFYLVFSVLLLFRRAWLLPLLLAWAAIVVAAGAIAPQSLSPAARIALHPYALEFIAGALVALFCFSRHAARVPAWAAWLALAAALLAGLPLVRLSGVLDQETLRHAAVLGGLYGLLVLAMVRLEMAGRLAVPGVLRFVGDISYTVYLSHVLVLGVIGRVWQLTTPVPDSLGDNTLAVLLMFAAVVVYGWLGFRLVEQPLLRASHRLRARWFGAAPAAAAVQVGSPS